MTGNTAYSKHLGASASNPTMMLRSSETWQQACFSDRRSPSFQQVGVVTPTRTLRSSESSQQVNFRAQHPPRCQQVLFDTPTVTIRTSRIILGTAQPAAPLAGRVPVHVQVCSGTDATISTTQRRSIEVLVEVCASASSADAPKEAEIPSTPLALLHSDRSSTSLSSVVSIPEDHKGGSEEASQDTSASSPEPSEVALYEKRSSRGSASWLSLGSILEEHEGGSEASHDTSASSLLVGPGSVNRSNGTPDEGPEKQPFCVNPPDGYDVERVPGAMEPQIVEPSAVSEAVYEQDYFPDHAEELCWERWRR